MPKTVVDLPRLVAQSTGTNSATQGIGSLDDAEAITIYPRSTGGWAVGAIAVQVAQFDPSLPGLIPANQSTVWNAVSTSSPYAFTSSNTSVTISPVAFRGLRLIGTSSSATGEVVAYVTKAIRV